MILTNEDASRLLKALIMLESHEEGTATVLLDDLVKKLEPAATVWDCQQRAARDVDERKYALAQDVFEWIEYEASARELGILEAWLADHPQGASETGQLSVGGFISLEG